MLLEGSGGTRRELAHTIPVHAKLLNHKFDVRILGRLKKLLRERQIDALVTVGAGDKCFGAGWLRGEQVCRWLFLLCIPLAGLTASRF